MGVKIYSYGANPPMLNVELVREQMHLAHKYHNKLIEIERERRARVEAALLAIAPDLVKVEEELARLEAEVSTLLEAAAKTNATARKRLPLGAAAAAALKDVKSRRKECFARRKTLRSETFASASWKSSEESIEAWAGGENRAARAACGVYWGTYLTVEESMKAARKGAPPEFRRWDGTGKVAVQIQGGMTVPELASDRRLQLETRPDGVWVEGKRRPRKLGTAVVRLRIGSSGRDPVWTEIPIHYHRPLPPDAVIKWAWLVRRPVGTHDEWAVQFTIESADSRTRASDGAAGIDVGWRMVEGHCPRVTLNAAYDGKKQRPAACTDARHLRIASVKRSDGAVREITLPCCWLSAMRKTRDLQSIRSRQFNVARDALIEVFAARRAALGADAPEWLARTASLASWKNEQRLAAVVARWRAERWPGDEAAFATAEAWRRQERHLYEYQANLREQLYARRNDIYRNEAAKLAKEVKTAFIERLDLRDFHALPKPGEVADAALKEHVRDAGLGIFRRLLKEAVAETIEVPAPLTTRRCFDCAKEGMETVAPGPVVQLESVCARGHAWDQDRNAAANILASGEALLLERAALDGGDGGGGGGCGAAPKPKRVRKRPKTPALETAHAGAVGASG